MVEIELKFQIKRNQIEKIIKELQKKGFSLVFPRTYEKTVMYDNPKKLMQITDGRIRLRISENLCHLSYKKPLTRDRIKKEEEYEVEVSDFKTAEKILQKMEFLPVSSYERYRTKLEEKTNKIQVTIDEYPFATFLEIEGQEEKIKSLALDLGFSLDDNLTDSCDTLFQKWRRKQGLGFKPHILFTDYDK